MQNSAQISQTFTSKKKAEFIDSFRTYQNEEDFETESEKKVRRSVLIKMAHSPPIMKSGDFSCSSNQDVGEPPKKLPQKKSSMIVLHALVPNLERKEKKAKSPYINSFRQVRPETVTVQRGKEVKREEYFNNAQVSDWVSKSFQISKRSEPKTIKIRRTKSPMRNLKLQEAKQEGKRREVAEPAETYIKIS